VEGQPVLPEAKPPILGRVPHDPESALVGHRLTRGVSPKSAFGRQGVVEQASAEELGLEITCGAAR